MLLTWSKPINDGGSPITGYLVEYKADGETHYTQANNGIETPSLSLVVTGLKPETGYKFRVYAVNKV